MKRNAEKQGLIFNSKGPSFAVSKPAFPPLIQFLDSFSHLFSGKRNVLPADYLMVPSCFSLMENYAPSFEFLRRLFKSLYNGKYGEITIDYKNCSRVDVDASICMDIIIAEFFNYSKICKTRGFKYKLKSILPVNFSADVLKVLVSIGAYKNFTNIRQRWIDVEPLPVLINSQNRPDKLQKSEVDITKIVEYIKQCLSRMQRDLSTEAETGFYKVIGEIISNAEEHATMPLRYAIGFFQETDRDDGHFGVFNLSIINFGGTIYETFKSPNCKNTRVVSQMQELSRDYTQRGLFTNAEFDEEILWTLYSLQEGVTSVDKRRGNGSIQYIENFFKLKGDMSRDDVSKLVIMSGHSRITFDGEYNIHVKTGNKRNFKMMTFNKTNEIKDKPDKKYVTFAPNFFPGTIISARILIKFGNIN